MVILVAATTGTVYGIGGVKHKIGDRLLVQRSEDNGTSDRRTPAYVRLNLTPEEEESMMLWNLFPRRSNQQWWKGYLAAKEEKAPRNVEPA